MSSVVVLHSPSDTTPIHCGDSSSSSSSSSRSSLHILVDDVISMVFTHLPLRCHHALFMTCRRLGIVARRPASSIHLNIASSLHSYIAATTETISVARIRHILRYQPHIYTLEISIHSQDEFVSARQRLDCLGVYLDEFRQGDRVWPHRLLLDSTDFPSRGTLESWIRRVPEVWCRGYTLHPHFCKLDNLVTVSCENFRTCDLVHLPSSLRHLDLTFDATTTTPSTSLAVEDASWHHVSHRLIHLRQLELRLFPVPWNDPWWLSLRRLTSLHTLIVTNLGPNPTLTTSPPFSSTFDLDTPILPALRSLQMYSSSERSREWPTSREWRQWSRWMPNVTQLHCDGFYIPPDISTWTRLEEFSWWSTEDTPVDLSHTLPPSPYLPHGATITTPTWPLSLSAFMLSTRHDCLKKKLTPPPPPISIWSLYITRLGHHLTHLSLFSLPQGPEGWTTLGQNLTHLRSLTLFDCRVDLVTFRVLTHHFSGLDRFLLQQRSNPSSYMDIFPLMTKWSRLVELQWCCLRFHDTVMIEFARCCPRSLRSLTTSAGLLTGEGILSALALLPRHLQHWYLRNGNPVFSSSQRLTIDSSTCTLHY